MFTKSSFVLFLLFVSSAKCVEFPECICRFCYSNYTIGMEFDKKCFFIPLDTYSPYSPSYKYQDRYEIFSHDSDDMNKTYSETMKQIAMQLSAWLKTGSRFRSL